MKNQNFETYPIGTKVQSLDQHGYFIMTASGIIEKHLGGGHALIRDFEGVLYSTVWQFNIYEIERIN